MVGTISEGSGIWRLMPTPAVDVDRTHELTSSNGSFGSVEIAARV
jgi:hypothetical protein